ncbi:glutamate 5-kinase [Pseudoalteromonas rubra]|uniref:Glutamate 5-kinase n=1 Tax=Pseudoalteromonas rubra TaxID=43658 RepID=A0A5S3WH43_9GAMM|nr:glutamate 5-kinase [Pseudoalteromonas rubra]TMP26168.1 glutamate 5-kinase [Pseudoalteromonas rubra]TMP32971.1 glutamate 5-kinase [Pseudoalteromonas rubra]
MKKSKVVVIKLGTSVLTAGTDKLNKPRMVDIVTQCMALKQQGYLPVLVSSGAVAAGRDAVAHSVGVSIAEKQMLAAIGQGQLIHLWQSLFSLFDQPVAQLLLTRADVEDRERYLNARDTITQLLKHQVIPIVNENDAVATSEIKVGDNDNLSALVAILANADKLMLLTDQPGLFTADPRSNPKATLISEVEFIDQSLMALAGGAGSKLGTGGMYTKLEAARTAQRAGIETIIAKGAEPQVIEQVMAGTAESTTFVRFDAPLEGRKKWLLSGPKSTGYVQCDPGAVTAITHQGASLLAKGVVAIGGEFSRGDVIEIRDLDSQLVAKGLVAFDHQEMDQIKRLHSSEIPLTLGYPASNVVVHRDDLVLLDVYAGSV